MKREAEDFPTGVTEKYLKGSADMDLLGDYLPTEDDPYMNPRQLVYFRRKLLRWREQLVKAYGESLGALKDKSRRETDLLDQGALEADTVLKVRTRDWSLDLISEIDEALERIEKGTYGCCEETGQAIGIRRLEALPIATLCLEAQERHERKKRRGKAYYR